MVTYNGQLSPGVREVIVLLISKESLQDVRVRETFLSKCFTNSYREESYKQSILYWLSQLQGRRCTNGSIE